MRLNITRWALVSAASTVIAAAMLPAPEPADAPGAPLVEPLGDNEIPNPVLDNIFEIGGDVAAFLRRMVPF